MSARAAVALGLAVITIAVLVAMLVDPTSAVTGAGLTTLGAAVVSGRFLLLLRVGLTLLTLGMAMAMLIGPDPHRWVEDPWFWLTIMVIAVVWLMPMRIRVPASEDDPLQAHLDLDVPD